MAEEWKDLARVWWNDIAMLGHDLAQGRHGNPLKFYDWLQSFADPRVGGWALMGSPLPTLAILGVYLTLIALGPRAMASRPAFELRLPMFVYNVLVCLLNGWMAIELFHCGRQRQYNFTCQLVDTSDNPYELRIAKAIWWYYASKGIEFMDSVFFVLRKKRSQLSFLHVYHHSTMFAFWWVGARFVPGGTALSAAMVNCFVHVLMYGYYALAAVQLRPMLGWKRRLTMLQLVQFSAGVLFGIRAIVTQCAFTRWMQYFFVCYAFSFILLFGQFYRRTYGVDGAPPPPGSARGGRLPVGQGSNELVDSAGGRSNRQQEQRRLKQQARAEPGRQSPSRKAKKSKPKQN